MVTRHFLRSAEKAPILDLDQVALNAAIRVEVDDGFVGPGYCQPTQVALFA